MAGRNTHESDKHDVASSLETWERAVVSSTTNGRRPFLKVVWDDTTTDLGEGNESLGWGSCLA